MVRWYRKHFYFLKQSIFRPCLYPLHVQLIFRLGKQEEIEEYKENKDPINLFRDKLLKEGVLTDDKIKALDKAAKDEAEASAEFALASPFPDVSELMDDVYWETDNPEEKSSSGTIFFESSR